MATTSEINLRDTALKVYSSTDGQLDIEADTEVEIDATTVDVNGALDVSGVGTFADNQIYGLAGDEDIAVTHTSATADTVGITTTITATNDGVDSLVLTHNAVDSDGSAGLRVALTDDDTAAGDSVYGIYVNVDANDSSNNDSVYGIHVEAIDGVAVPEALMVLNSSDTNQAVTDGLIISTGAGAITEAIDVSDAQIVTALNVGPNPIQLFDSAITISSVDGQLDIDADTEVEIATTTLDLNGILDVSGASNLGGTVTMATNTEINLRDTALKVYSSTDGQLDIDADTEVEIGTAALDVNASGAVTIDSTTDANAAVTIGTTVGGVSILANGDTAGDDLILDIDGTGSELTLNSEGTAANAIALQASAGGIDMDAALDANTAIALTTSAGGITITAGGDGAGDDLSLTATGTATEIRVTSASTVANDAIKIDAAAGGIDIDANGNNAGALTLTTGATTGGANETIIVTNTNGTNAAAIALTATAGGITATAAAAKNITLSTSTTGRIDLAAAVLMSDTNAISGPGALDITVSINEITSTGGDAFTIADGQEGQIMYLIFVTDGGDATLTPANMGGGSTITFQDAGDGVTLLFTNGNWYVVGNNGATIG